MTYRILVCDDDREIARAICIYLRSTGYEAVEAHDGTEVLELCRTQTFHLLILDIMMPGLDGIQTTEILRRTHNIPVIMLSAKSEDIDKIDGLTAGADDYMTKPFQPAELIARVKSQLRRYTSLGGMYQNQAPATTVYQTGELIVDDASKTVTVDGEPVSLTPREYGILCFLTQHAGQVFSISQIYEAVWQEPAYNSENTVAVHIRQGCFELFHGRLIILHPHFQLVQRRVHTGLGIFQGQLCAVQLRLGGCPHIKERLSIRDILFCLGNLLREQGRLFRVALFGIVIAHRRRLIVGHGGGDIQLADCLPSRHRIADLHIDIGAADGQRHRDGLLSIGNHLARDIALGRN